MIPHYIFRYKSSKKTSAKTAKNKKSKVVPTLTRDLEEEKKKRETVSRNTSSDKAFHAFIRRAFFEKHEKKGYTLHLNRTNCDWDPTHARVKNAPLTKRGNTEYVNGHVSLNEYGPTKKDSYYVFKVTNTPVDVDKSYYESELQ